MIFKNDQEPAEITENLLQLVSSNSRFALDLYQHLRTFEGNLFYSPYSITFALAMTYAGARENTRRQMADVLGFTEDDESIHNGFKTLGQVMENALGNHEIQLAIANSLWPQEGYRLRRAYLNLVKKYYRTKVTRVNYGEVDTARTNINHWVEDLTAGKIQNLIGEGVLDSLTRLVLVNAIYFKGDWEHQFDESQTDEQTFHPASGTDILVKMMHIRASFPYYEDNDLQILEVPYRGKRISMLVLLPRETDGVSKLEEVLTVENLEKWTSSLEKMEVNVSLPKFELTFPFRLDEKLQQMGMTDAFTSSADFSGIEESRELFLNAVLHKAFVAVNEKGTEAAAATAVIMQTKSIAFMSVDFTADHPFIFLIRENSTGSILFMGRVNTPETIN